MALNTPANIYTSAQNARAMASKLNAGDQPIQNVIDVAINSAINLGLFSCTASMSGYNPQLIQDNMNMLQQYGYTVTLTGATPTINISW